MRIRPYETDDRDACLALIRSNTPEHFVPSDEEAFGRFLDDLPGPYFVVEDPYGGVIACGGMAQEEEPSLATLCWGIVAAEEQRKGVGTALLEHRLREFLPRHPEIERVQVNTTQKVQGFYERHGFRAREIRQEAYGPGLDHVRMERQLAAR